MKRHQLLSVIFIFLILCSLLLSTPATYASPLDLKTCINASLENSPDIIGIENEIVDRLSSRESARKDRYPNVSLGYAMHHQFEGESSYSFSDNDYFSYNVTVSQPLYKGGSLTASVEKAAIAIQQAELSREAVISKRIFDVSYSFYDLLKKQRVEDVAKQAVVRLEAHVKDSKAFFEAGLIPKNDFLESDVQLAQGRHDLLLAQNDSALARSVLNVMMNKPAEAPLAVFAQPNEAAAFELSWQEALETALRNRSEPQEIKLQTDSLAQDMILTKSSYLPSVSLSARYQKQGDDLLARNFSAGSSEAQSAQAVMTWNLWQWRQQDDKVAQVTAQVTKNQAQLSAMNNAITLQVREAYLLVQQANAHIQVTQAAISQAEENYRINEARYQAQLNTSTQVLDAQTLLVRAETNHSNALYDEKIAKTRLNWAMGILFARGDDQKQK